MYKNRKELDTVEKFDPNIEEPTKEGKEILAKLDLYNGDALLESIVDEHILDNYKVTKAILATLKSTPPSGRKKVLLTYTPYKKKAEDCLEEAIEFTKKYIDCDQLKCSIDAKNKKIIIFKKIGFTKKGFLKSLGIPSTYEKDVQDANFLENYLKFVVRPNLVSYVEKNLLNKTSYAIGVSDIYQGSNYTNIDVQFEISISKLDSKKLADVELAMYELNDYATTDILKR